MIFFQQFYLDKEKDIAVDLRMEGERLLYTIRTPNHHSGNLITNLAKLCGLRTEEDDRGLRQLQAVWENFAHKNVGWRMDPFSALFLLVLNFKWDILKDKDLAKLNIKRGSDRISGID